MKIYKNVINIEKLKILMEIEHKKKILGLRNNVVKECSQRALTKNVQKIRKIIKNLKYERSRKM